MPVPVDPEQVMETVVDNVLLKRVPRERQLELALSTPDVSRLHAAWDEAAEREQRQRGFFSQRGIRPDEVAREIEATDSVLGEPDAVRRFVADALQRFRRQARTETRDRRIRSGPGRHEGPASPHCLGNEFPMRVAFSTVRDPVPVLGRTHPAVATLCEAVLGQAFGGEPDALFARTGAMRTDAVRLRTVLVLLRLRYTLEEEVEEFAEEVVLAAFERRDGRLHWLEPLETAGREIAAAARPVGNVEAAEKAEQIGWALEFLTGSPRLVRADRRSRGWRSLRRRMRRLRKLTKAPRLKVLPHEPPDILGCFRAPPVRAVGVSRVGITVEGGLLAADLVERIAAVDTDVPGQQPKDFGIDAGRLSAEIQAAFSDIRLVLGGFKRRRAYLQASPVSLTREAWVIPLLERLGYTLQFQRAAAQIGGQSYPLSHRIGEAENATPVHIVALDHSSANAARRAEPACADAGIPQPQRRVVGHRHQRP